MTNSPKPFLFVAASYLVRIRSDRAKTLKELAECIRTVSEQSIFYHTFQALESHHYTMYSNDFAQWTMAACNEPVLAEELGSVDVRDFTSIVDLRAVLLSTVQNFLQGNPQAADRLAFEPFYFCEAIEVTIPLETSANNLAELAVGIGRMSLQTLHYHFINSHLRGRLGMNDFSTWIKENLGNQRLAERLERIDFYTNTLEGVREEILGALQS